MEQTFGTLLKGWRNERRMSQLDLGLAANVSARHVSFIETGRARPSRSMVLQLSETLQVPRPERNALLNAAGFAAAYEKRDLDAGEMAHVRAAVDWTLTRHDPFPAIAVDRHWSVVSANQCGQMLLSGIGLDVGDSLLDAMLYSEAVRDAVVNWPEVAHHTMMRLRTESAHLGGDPVLDEAANRLAEEIGTSPPHDGAPLPAIVPATYRANGMVLSFFSTIAQFGTAEDIALADLKIELMFPADDVTRQVLLAGQAQSAGAPG
jgi:transcriptional regulator with XRE-family HTH domain